MKKVLGIILSVCMIVSLLAVVFAVSASADDPAPFVAKEIRLKNDDGEVKWRNGADLTKLCDGIKHMDYNTGKTPEASNFDREGIVLLQNVNCGKPEEFDTADVIIDLGESKSVDTVNVSFYHYLNSMIGTPKDGKVTISYSPDGNDFSEIGTFDMENQADDETVDGVFDEYFDLGKIYTCRAIMVSMTYGATKWESKPVLEWFGFTELSAGLRIDYDAAEPEQPGDPDDGKSEDTSEDEPEDPTTDLVLPTDAIVATVCTDATINTSIIGGAKTVVTDFSKIPTLNLRWTVDYFLKPEEDGTYTITAIYTSKAGTDPEYDDPADGTVILALHDDGSNPEAASYKLKEAWAQLSIGDKVVISGYDFENGTKEEGAFICALGEEQPGDTSSEDPDTDKSEAPVVSQDTESKEEASKEESKTEESKPTTSDEGGSMLWLWIVIAVVVVAAVAVVAVVVVKKKK